MRVNEKEPASFFCRNDILRVCRVKEIILEGDQNISKFIKESGLLLPTRFLNIGYVISPSPMYRVIDRRYNPLSLIVDNTCFIIF